MTTYNSINMTSEAMISQVKLRANCRIAISDRELSKQSKQKHKRAGPVRVCRARKQARQARLQRGIEFENQIPRGQIPTRGYKPRNTKSELQVHW